MPQDQTPDLLIVGASVRAAAFSALRAGLVPRCLDLFADCDLSARCDASAVRPYPTGLITAAQAGPPIAWMYTGALENHPNVLAELAQHGPLIGSPADVVRRVRDPHRVHAELTRVGLHVPEVRPSSEPPPADGTWLLKGKHSAAGNQVFAWNEAARSKLVASGGWYFQKRITGLAAASLYVGNGTDACWIGLTEQCLGPEWHHRKPFGYAGSLGPLEVPDFADRLKALGQQLAATFQLRGIFGIDGILNADGFWPVEINPRWSASVEVLERAGNFSAIRWHWDACNHGKLPALAPSGPGWLDGYVGKVILFVPERDVLVSPALAASLQQKAASCWPWPEVADLPAAGTLLAAGHPAFTIFASGGTKEEVRAILHSRLATWSERLTAEV